MSNISKSIGVPKKLYTRWLDVMKLALVRLRYFEFEQAPEDNYLSNGIFSFEAKMVNSNIIECCLKIKDVEMLTIQHFDNNTTFKTLEAYLKSYYEM